MTAPKLLLSPGGLGEDDRFFPSALALCFRKSTLQRGLILEVAYHETIFRTLRWSNDVREIVRFNRLEYRQELSNHFDYQRTASGVGSEP